MSERDLIREAKDGPVVCDRLVGDLTRLGVKPGMTLLVHSSLRSMGWVVGGPVAVVNALLGSLGPGGTLVMPTHSGDLTDPSGWSNPPVDSSWWPIIRQAMPAFDRELTPTRGMGAIPECFRGATGVLRSDHPHVSFAALGPEAEFVTSGHVLDSSFGESSPLARIYELQGMVLLLGVGHESNTSLHLAEMRANYPTKRVVKQGAPVRVDGVTRWTEFQDLDPDSDDFAEIGRAFASANQVSQGRVGAADSNLFGQRGLVDFAVEWIEANKV